MSSSIVKGTMKADLPEPLVVPEKAGQLTPKEVLDLPKARSGVGLTCNQVASAMEKTEGRFVVPGVTPEQLRLAGQRAELWDEVIADMGLVQFVAKQANLIDDAAAYELLRKVNHQVKAQAAFDPEIRERFAALTEYFTNDRSKSKGKTEPQEG